MSAQSRPAIVDRLRAERRNIDWRRERPHPALEQLRSEVEEAIAARRLNHVQRMELRALLHRLALDPLPTLEGLIEVVETASPRTRAALRMLHELVLQWNEALGALRGRGCDEVGLRGIRQAAAASMRAFAGRHPANEDVQHLHAVFLRRSQGARALLDHVERDPSPGLRVLAEYFAALVDLLARQPDAAILARAFAATLPAVDPSSPVMLCFRVHRAAVARMLAWNCDMRSSFGDAALRAALRAVTCPDPAKELEAVRLALPTCSTERSEFLIGLCGCAALWRCPALELPRLALLELLMAAASEAEEAHGLHRLLKALLEYAPQSIAFWSGTGFARRVHDLVVQAGALLPAGIHASLLGLSAFALPDLDLVRDSYARADAAGVTSSPQLTYLDPRAVVRCAGQPAAFGGSYRLLGTPAPACPEDAAPVAVTSADPGYIRLHARDWARSLRASGSRTAAHLHVIGDPALIAAELAEFRGLLSDRAVTFSAEEPPVERAFYYATARFLHLRRWLAQFGRTVIVTDIDMHWTQPPEALASIAGDGDVGLRLFDRVRHYIHAATGEVILRYPRLKLWECTSASCVLARPTEGGRRFAGLLAELAAGHLARFLAEPGSHWFIDQNILSALYAHLRRHAPGIAIRNLDERGLGLSGYAAHDEDWLAESHGLHWIAGNGPLCSRSPSELNGHLP